MVSISVVSSISITVSSISVVSVVSISIGISRPLGNNMSGSNGGVTSVSSVDIWVASVASIGVWVVGSIRIGSMSVGHSSWGSNGLHLGNSGIISLGSLDHGVHGGQAVGEAIAAIGVWVSVASVEKCRGSIGSSNQTNNQELHLELF